MLFAEICIEVEYYSIGLDAVEPIMTKRQKLSVRGIEAPNQISLKVLFAHPGQFVIHFVANYFLRIIAGIFIHEVAGQHNDFARRTAG